MARCTGACPAFRVMISVVTIAIAIVLMPVSTVRAQQRCLVVPTGTIYETDGSADEGFGQPVAYRTPQTNIRQGATQAGSDPKTPLHVEGLGLAVRAGQAKNAANTLSKTKAISDFVINRRSLCTINLSSSTSIIHLRDGIGGFIASATIETAGRGFVANVQRTYSIQPNVINRNFADIYLGKAKIRTVPNPGGNLSPPDMAKTNLVLAAGKYRLIVEITVTTKAEQQTDLVATAVANLH